MQNLHHLHNTSANHVTFANHKQDKLRTSYTYYICLHICRLVLTLTNFTMLTVFCVKIYVFSYQIVQLFQDHWFELSNPNNLQTKIPNVVGTQGSMQFIC